MDKVSKSLSRVLGGQSAFSQGKAAEKEGTAIMDHMMI